jgi:hypothetical protein
MRDWESTVTEIGIEFRFVVGIGSDWIATRLALWEIKVDNKSSCQMVGLYRRVSKLMASWQSSFERGNGKKLTSFVPDLFILLLYSVRPSEQHAE